MLYNTDTDTDKMKQEGEEEGSVGSVESVEGAGPSNKKQKGQQKITSSFPPIAKAAAHAGTTILGLMIGVGLMLLKGVAEPLSSKL